MKSKSLSPYARLRAVTWLGLLFTSIVALMLLGRGGATGSAGSIVLALWMAGSVGASADLAHRLLQAPTRDAHPLRLQVLALLLAAVTFDPAMQVYEAKLQPASTNTTLASAAIAPGG